MHIKLKTVITKQLQAEQRSARVTQMLASALERSARKIERAAKHNAPVAFGQLRADIAAQGPQRRGTVVFWSVGVRNSNYAPFVEFGTGPAGAKSALSPEAQQAMADMGYSHGPGNFIPPVQIILQWVRKKGLPESAAWPIARQIGRAGLTAHPFLFPAYIAEKEKFAAAVARAAQMALA